MVHFYSAKEAITDVLCKGLKASEKWLNTKYMSRQKEPYTSLRCDIVLIEEITGKTQKMQQRGSVSPASMRA